MNILLINPLCRLPYRVPLGLGYVASVIRQEGHNVRILDINAFGYSDKEVEEKIRDSDWNPGNAVIIYFSGEFRKDRAEQNGKWYVSASFMEKRENICKLLKDISKI